MSLPVVMYVYRPWWSPSWAKGRRIYGGCPTYTTPESAREGFYRYTEGYPPHGLERAMIFRVDPRAGGVVFGYTTGYIDVDMDGVPIEGLRPVTA